MTIVQEALDTMDEAIREITYLRAQNTHFANILLELREKLSLFVDEIEDEGDRVYLGSTNHADYLREAEERMTEIWYEQEDPIAFGAKGRDLFAELREANELIRDQFEALRTYRDYISDTAAGVDLREFKTMANDDLARIDALIAGALSPSPPASSPQHGDTVSPAGSVEAAAGGNRGEER
jgi:hypothetical protein